MTLLYKLFLTTLGDLYNELVGVLEDTINCTIKIMQQYNFSNIDKLPQPRQLQGVSCSLSGTSICFISRKGLNL